MENDFIKEAAREDPTPIDWSEYWRLFVANIWIIASITGIVFLGASLYYSSLPNVYTADARILVERVENYPRSSSEMMITPSFSGQEDYYGTQIAILTGRTVRERVSKDLPDAPPYGVSARRLPKTRIILLSVTQRDPVWAAKIANRFAQIYLSASTEEQLFIGKQILEMIPEEKMDSEEAALLKDTDSLEEMKKFNKKEYAESLTAITNDTLIQKLRIQKIDIEAGLNELNQRYKPSHPLVRDSRERLTFIDNELKARTRRILGNIRSNLSGENRIINVKILETALPPRSPSSPNRPRGVVGLTFLGFCASIALMLTLEYSNQRIRTERDFSNVPLPFLGNIPVLSELSKKNKKAVENQLESVSLVDLVKQNPILADAVANVRTHILFSMPYEKSKRIMLTSCIPDEGKTTVSALLSLSLTSLGRKILLIDADMRRPFTHHYLGLKNAKGLSDYLTGQATIEEIVREVPGSTLKIITAGTMSPNPSELVASDLFRQILEYGSENYDRIVIDVPPVLFIPDGLIVAKHVHSGVLICGSGMVHKKTVKIVKEKFDSIGHSFIGIILNKVNYEKGVGRYKYYRTYKNYYSKITPSNSKADV